MDSLMRPQMHVHRAVPPPPTSNTRVRVQDADAAVTPSGTITPGPLKVSMGLSFYTYSTTDTNIEYVSPYRQWSVDLGHSTELMYDLEINYRPTIDSLPTKSGSDGGLVYEDSMTSTWRAYYPSIYNKTSGIVMGLGTTHEGNWAIGLNKIQLQGVRTSSNVVTNLSLYPNPLSDVATIDFDVVRDGWFTLEIRDALGRIVADLGNHRLLLGENTLSIDASKLIPGAYQLIVRSAGSQQTAKFVKQ
jgi:hypothetical protein